MSDVAFLCPQCGDTDGLVRLSRIETIFSAPVAGIRREGAIVSVDVDGERAREVESSVRMMRIDCTRCGFGGQPDEFIVRDPAQPEADAS